VFHGTENIAGIGGHMARWQRAHGIDALFLVYRDQTPHRNHDVNLDLPGRVPRALRDLVRLWTLARMLLRYDIFHFYYGRTFLRGNLDLPLLKLFRRKVLMTYCGDDIRLAEIEARRNPYWRAAPEERKKPGRDRTRIRRMRWHRLWVDRFFAPRNLYASATRVIEPDRIESELWLHNTLDCDAWTPRDYATREVPVLVHAPTDRGIKGTAHVEAAVERLRARGLKFEFRLVEGVSNAEAQRIYRDEADVIVDQFVLGGIGTLAFEGMYFGKPVVSYLLEEVRREHFPDCPVVGATIDELEDRLAWLIENPAERVRLGREGRAFVERRVDRDTVARRVVEIYRDLWLS
jgi:glycosyltransferase involved in cell wall biosynthesis